MASFSFWVRLRIRFLFLRLFRSLFLGLRLRLGGRLFFFLYGLFRSFPGLFFLDLFGLGLLLLTHFLYLP